jgi:peptide deformylase
MALRKIAQIGHPILRTPARPLTLAELQSSEIQSFIDDLIATMRDANGAGLAAPQIFEPLQICALEVENNPRYPYKPRIPLTILVNPKLTPLSEAMFDNYEGCLSVPNLRGKVPRFAELQVEAWDRHGNSLDFVAKGITAGTYQHEVDHLHAKLFVDRVQDATSFSTWAEFDRYHRETFLAEAQEVVARYGSLASKFRLLP